MMQVPPQEGAETLPKNVAMITLENVTVSKGGKKLFENLNFEIRSGQHLLIQGRNGSGKTLLLKVLAGIAHAQSGAVTCHFLPPVAEHDLRPDAIHFVPAHSLQSFLGGLDGSYYQQRYYNMDDTQIPNVRDIIGEEAAGLNSFMISHNFDITHLLDLPVTRLSNGQLKKVILLRQLAKAIPRFLLLDYPFAGLDSDSRTDLAEFLEDITARFAMQVIVVDTGEELPRMINTRIVLDGFRIVTEGPLKPASVSRPALPIVSSNPDHNHRAPVVEMRNVTIAYGNKTVIANLDWSIHKGERWALTGKNGSGKTTLFGLIFADHPMAYSQQVFLFGKRRGSGESIWDIKNRITYFGPEQIHFQNFQYMQWSARQYIREQDADRSGRLEELISFFDAGGYADLPVRFLSSGQLQMMMLIIAFLNDKELLLLDEPFQFLDAENHRNVNRYLDSHLGDDTTLVMITHDERDVAMWTQYRKHLG